jgi:hypothetical protein
MRVKNPIVTSVNRPIVAFLLAGLILIGGPLASVYVSLQNQRTLETVTRVDAIVCEFVRLVVNGNGIPSTELDSLEKAASSCPPIVPPKPHHKK